MATWYRARCTDITPVEVERETALCVFIGGRRMAKASEYESYFPVEADAVAHVLEQASRKVEAAKARVKTEESRYAKLLEQFAASAAPTDRGEG